LTNRFSVFCEKKVDKWKNAIFSKSSNVPILKICGVISEHLSQPKKLDESDGGFSFLGIIFSSHVATRRKYLRPW